MRPLVGAAALPVPLASHWPYAIGVLSVLSCLSICELGVLWPNSWMDQALLQLSCSSPATWNSIPISIKNCSSLYSFKRHLKSYFIAQLTNN